MATLNILTDLRFGALSAWLELDLNLGAERIVVASADASFRRYFRAIRGSETFIVMDAPPEKENIEPYVNVARMLADTGVNVPQILAEDRERGFLLLTDLGSELYLNDLSKGENVDALYADAMIALCQIQSRGREHAANLPPYDRKRLTDEMNLMPEWFCGRHLGLKLSDDERVMLTQTFDMLADEALAQPQVFVHRDYHSRNLMICAPNDPLTLPLPGTPTLQSFSEAGERIPMSNPGILDFQDAVRGAVTYDLVSLLKDCYVVWPRERVVRWVEDYRLLAQNAGVAHGMDRAQFLRAFDLMGVQRHLKVLGIFARLFHRDGKSGYLKDLPRVLEYVTSMCAEYPQLSALGQFLQARVRL
jgi:aminoglycoside/choline kinase family phosphotransferase